MLTAEAVYNRLVCEGELPFGPGWSLDFQWRLGPPEGGASWPLAAEVLPNAVWRRGRLFLRCPACDRRGTRLYVPLRSLQPRCRRCWGLSYESQTWNYHPTRFLGSLLNSQVARDLTTVRRAARRRAARARYEARRRLL